MDYEHIGSKPITTGISSNIDEQVAISIEAVSILGLDIVKDRDKVSEFLHNKYKILKNNQSRPGEPYVQLPIDNDFRLRTMLDKIDNNEYRGEKYPKFSVWYKAPWTISSKDVNFFHRNIQRADVNNSGLRHLTGQARLAINDGEKTLEPLIHFADMPYDIENVDSEDKDKTTQIELLHNEIKKYEFENPNFNMIAMDVASYAMIALQRRIKGEKMPFTWGVMNIPCLGRKKTIGGSAINIVHSNANGQLGLGWSRGNRSLLSGIGISIGQNE
jgi:hypothetical protein